MPKERQLSARSSLRNWKQSKIQYYVLGLNSVKCFSGSLQDSTLTITQLSGPILRILDPLKTDVLYHPISRTLAAVSFPVSEELPVLPSPSKYSSFLWSYDFENLNLTNFYDQRLLCPYM